MAYEGLIDLGNMIYIDRPHLHLASAPASRVRVEAIVGNSFQVFVVGSKTSALAESVEAP